MFFFLFCFNFPPWTSILSFFPASTSHLLIRLSWKQLVCDVMANGCSQKQDNQSQRPRQVCQSEIPSWSSIIQRWISSTNPNPPSQGEEKERKMVSLMCALVPRRMCCSGKGRQWGSSLWILLDPPWSLFLPSFVILSAAESLSQWSEDLLRGHADGDA